MIAQSAYRKYACAKYNIEKTVYQDQNDKVTEIEKGTMASEDYFRKTRREEREYLWHLTDEQRRFAEIRSLEMDSFHVR